MAETPIVLIRAFTPEDGPACKEIVSDAVSRFTNPMFIHALFKETIYYLMIFVVAISFVFFGVPFKVTLLFLPFVLAFAYLAARMSNAVRALELQQDLNAVNVKYDPMRGAKLFVAELCEFRGAVPFEQAAGLKSDRQRKEAIGSFFFLFEGHYNEQAFYSKLQGSKKRIIGMVGVAPSERDPRRGFMKRLFVRSPYSGSAVVEKLVDAVVQHSRDFGFLAVDTICTEVNEDYREVLFAKKFSITVSYHRFLLGLVAYMGVNTFSLGMKASRSALEA